MKPSAPKIGLDGFTTDTVTWLFSNIGFTRETDQFHHEHRQSHQRYRFLNSSSRSVAIGRNYADASETPQDDSAAASSEKADDVPPSASTSLRESLRAVTARCACSPQISRAIVLASGSQPKRSVPKLDGRYTLTPGCNMSRGLQTPKTRGSP